MPSSSETFWSKPSTLAAMGIWALAVGIAMDVHFGRTPFDAGYLSFATSALIAPTAIALVGALFATLLNFFGRRPTRILSDFNFSMASILTVVSAYLLYTVIGAMDLKSATSL